MDYDKKNKKFISWLNKPLKRKLPTYSNNEKYYESSLVYYEDNIVKRKVFVNNFIEQLNSIVIDNDYIINNNKEFRDEIACFIYKYSKKNE